MGKLLQNFPARCGIAILSGAVYAGAFPPLDWGWLILPGILGLLLVLKGQRGSRARLLGFLHGMTAIGISLSWTWNIFASYSVALWCILAVFTVLFAEMQSRAERCDFKPLTFALFTALNWTACEFIRSEIFHLKFPWMTAGLAVGPNILLPWIGIYCVGFIVVFLLASCSVRLWKYAAGATAILIAVVLISSPHPQPKADDPDAVRVHGFQLEGVSLNEYLAGTQSMPEGIDHAVWPEYAVPFDIRKNERDWNLILELCREKDITLTFGTQSTSASGDEWRNIALTMDPSGYRAEHNKVHTVHFFDDGTPGKIKRPVPTSHGMVGTPICFDFDYTDVSTAMTSLGAEYFVVPTMDAESWSARQHDQHAELAIIRAAETGRWVFVVATSGVSQLIDPSGHLHARLGALEQGEISGILKREKNLTFHTRFGWRLPWGALGLAVILWVRLLFVRGEGKKPRSAP